MQAVPIVAPISSPIRVQPLAPATLQAISIAQESAPPSEVPPASAVPPDDPLLEPLDDPLLDPLEEPLLDPLEEPLLDPLDEPLPPPLLLPLSVSAGADASSLPVPKPPPLLLDEHAASNPSKPPDAHTNLLIFNIDCILLVYVRPNGPDRSP